MCLHTHIDIHCFTWLCTFREKILYTTNCSLLYAQYIGYCTLWLSSGGFCHTFWSSMTLELNPFFESWAAGVDCSHFTIHLLWVSHISHVLPFFHCYWNNNHRLNSQIPHGNLLGRIKDTCWRLEITAAKMYSDQD